MLSTNKNFSDKDKDILLEALKENWASARYHESTRLKYFYYYFAAVGGILIYFTKEYLDGSVNLSSLCAGQLLVISLVSFFLAAVGYIALGHLIYANAEYGNHIRAVQYIARDLGLNRGIDEYLKKRGKKINAEACEIKVERSAYMALPLGLGIRSKLGNIKIYFFFISILFTISFVSFVSFFNYMVFQSFKLQWASFFDVPCVRWIVEKNLIKILLVITYIVVFFLIYFYLRCWVSLKEHLVAGETDARDPRKSRSDFKKYWPFFGK